MSRGRRRARHRQDRARRDVPRRAPAERAPGARRVLAGAHGGSVQRARGSRARRDRRERRRVVRRHGAAHRARGRRRRAAPTRRTRWSRASPRSPRTSSASSRRGDDEDAHYRKKLLVSGVRHLVAAIALEQPLVVVIDGLQWADKPTLDLVAELLKHADPLPVLACSSRAPTIASRRSSRAWCASSCTGSRARSRFAWSRRGSACSDGVRQVCAELVPRVGGNPFFLLEMVDALLERGVLEIRDDALVRPHGAATSTRWACPRRSSSSSPTASTSCPGRST